MMSRLENYETCILISKILMEYPICPNCVKSLLRWCSEVRRVETQFPTRRTVIDFR